MPRKVTFQGVHLWAREPLDDGSYSLAPPDHVDGQGNIADFFIALTGEAYAHVFPPHIKRYGRIIGREGDLQEGWV